MEDTVSARISILPQGLSLSPQAQRSIQFITDPPLTSDMANLDIVGLRTQIQANLFFLYEDRQVHKIHVVVVQKQLPHAQGRYWLAYVADTGMSEVLFASDGIFAQTVAEALEALLAKMSSDVVEGVGECEGYMEE